MATDVVRADTGVAAAERPYAPSWLNVLIDWVERAPGPPWVIYVLAAIPAILLSNVGAWFSGISPGQFTITSTFWGPFAVALIGLVHYLDRVAEGSLASFRPTLTIAEPEIARLRYELTVIPARPAAIILIGSISLTLTYFVLDPVASQVVGLTPVALVLRTALEAFITAVLLTLIYHTLRQLRIVRRILDRGTRIDLFHPSPLYAFARLTSRTAIVLIGVAIATALVNPIQSSNESYVVLYFSWYVGFIVFAAAVFVYPLLGLHDRLVAEKDRLEGESEERLRRALEELNRDVDSRELGRADVLNKTLASLLLQRDVLAKLPTWPWSTGTLRGFLTAIMLPVALFLVQRVLAQLI